MTEIINITDRERAKDRLIAQLSAGRDALAARLDKVLSDLAQAPTTLSVAKSIAAEQADDPSLWFVATTATEAHLQHALRHLAAAVEGTLVSSAKRLPLVQATAPREIWLQVSDDAEHSAEPFPTDHDGIAWAKDAALMCAVPYVRADLAQAQPAPAQRLSDMQIADCAATIRPYPKELAEVPAEQVIAFVRAIEAALIAAPKDGGSPAFGEAGRTTG